MTNKQKTNNKKIIVVSVLTIIVASTIATVYIIFKNTAQTAFYARSINDATYDCEDKIDNQYDDDLVSKYYDQLSSTYEADKHQYRIYYRISVRVMENNLPTIKDYVAKCIVWERLGYVSDFQVLDIL